MIENCEFDELSDTLRKALNDIVLSKFGCNYSIKSVPISGCGENSYGSVLQLKIESVQNPIEPFYCIVKISPKNEARRTAMKVVDYYIREIFIYEEVLTEYEKLQDENDLLKNYQEFNSAPIMYYSSLKETDEFLILEDLHQTGYSRFNRQKPLTYHHTRLALKELAKFHAMSFILREKKSRIFNKLIDQIRSDNLFSENIEQISVEFGKKYINKTIAFITKEANIEIKNKMKIIKDAEKLCDNFKDICIKLVNGKSAEPYSVICHGDFWNNNVLYQYDENGIPKSAKIIDFQMARYASPVLDFVHYLFTCTEKSLRDKHFQQFKDSYYNTLADHLKSFDLDPNKIFPKYIFKEHLKKYGIYGFCMAVYAVPFFISDSCDIPNLDEVSEAIRDISESSSEDGSSDSNSEDEKSEKTYALLDEYELLTERTIPIFKERMIGILIDLDKYKMLNNDFL